MTDTKLAEATKKTAIATLDPQALIQQAITEGAGIETMERLVALAKDVRQENARDAWYNAMAEFQTKCPAIKKTATANIVGRNNASFKYSYAPLDEILETVRPVMGPLGLSVSWRGRFEGKVVVQNCRVSHVAGHFEESGELPIPIDEGGMGASAAQRIGIATTYAKRYSLLSIIGMAPESDDDAGGDPPKTVKQPERKSTKPAASIGCPETSPWEGDLDDVKTLEPDVFVLSADQGRLTFYTSQADIKDKAASAMSNAQQVRIEWKKTPKGNAEVETLAILQDA